jgi:hypothetical protein
VANSTLPSGKPRVRLGALPELLLAPLAPAALQQTPQHQTNADDQLAQLVIQYCNMYMMLMWGS